MKSIQYFLNKSKIQSEIIIKEFGIEQKNELISQLIEIIENIVNIENVDVKSLQVYLDLFSLLETNEISVIKLFKNKMIHNKLLSIYINLYKKINYETDFFLKYAKYIDISEENYVLLFTEPHIRILSDYTVNRNVLNKNFTEEQKKYILENFNQWYFHERTKYTVEEKKIFMEKIGFLPFLLYHSFEKNNPDNEYMIYLIIEKWNQILKMQEDYHNFIEYEQTKEIKPKRFYLIHLSPNDFMFTIFFNSDGKVKTLEDIDIDSYLKLCSLDKRLHQNMLDSEYIYFYPEIGNILEERLNNYLILENF